MQHVVPGARWIGAVHVGVHGDNGLSFNELKQARESGMVRLTTGFESGSQRILDGMVKGTNLDVTSRFLIHAKRAGISIRTTMIIGYPGEEVSDIDLTTEFLKEHENCIERIKLNRLQIKSGTQFARLVARKVKKFPDIVVNSANHRQAHVYHHFKPTEDAGYRRAISRLLRVVHRINRKPLVKAARDFEGVM
jgi:biotin synthase-like enzyme